MRPIIEFDALTDLEQYVSAFPEATTEAARIALNDVSDGEGLAVYRKAIESEIDYPEGYITTDRLGVTTKATNSKLAVTITGRQRATSLARFARGGQTVASTRRAGVRVKVSKQGGGGRMERAWLVRLNKGSSKDRDNYNLGLAIRLEPGERLRNKREVRSVQLDQNVYLLYGPSIDQVFRDVAITETPPVLDKIGNEFFRQFFRIVGSKRRGR
ncbi:hypothetical protein [Sphingomonas phage Carli]|nr:hypothetical protein [Sphingomonas phage Carli]